MKTARGRNATLLIVMAASAVMMSGCTVGFRGFSMDSISRVPFFGFEVKEWRPKSSAPVYNSISLSDNEAARIEPAIKTQTTTPSSNLLTLGLKNPFNSKSSDTPSAATQRFDQTPKSIAIPPTVSQGSFSPVDRATADARSSPDFQ